MPHAQLIIFPNQLFNKEIIASVDAHQVFLVEDPAFLGERRPVPLKLNKLRLAYQKYLCLKFVATNPRVQFIPYNEAAAFASSLTTSTTKPYMFNPIDHLVLAKYKGNVNLLNTPSFILSDAEVDDYCRLKKSNSKRLRHAPFYNYMKSKLNMLVDVANQDANNRAAYPRDAEQPPSPFPLFTRTNEDLKMMNASVEWVNTHFRNNPGPVDKDSVTYLLKLPNSPSEALIWLDKFVAERLGNFGKYEDAIVRDEQWMFHSGLSIPLNYGLITPKDILKKVATIKTNLASHEGFVRQIIGWREYCRLYYVCIPPSVYRQNHFGLSKRPLGKEWYTGKTGIPIVDDAIRDGWQYGYLHHIRRLMVMSNYMTLCKVHPDNVYKWMYEFSLDSNDVFMVFNCYSMGTYSDGGAAVHKPYVSGPAYIRKQSREPKGPWETVWLDKYHDFIKIQKTKTKPQIKM